MNDRMISALIDAYTLDDCIALLKLFAPDLLRQITDDVYLYPDDPQTLKKARRAVHETRARERQTH